MSLLWEHTAAALRAGDFLWRDRLDVSQLEKEVGQPARPRQTRLSPPHINRMPRVERPPIKPNVGAKPARLDEPLCTVVAALAQAHKRAKPEFVDVAVMWLDVIADRRRLDDADLRAIRTERVLEQLVPPDPRPAIRGVPLIPLRRLAANAHGSTYHPPAEAQTSVACRARGHNRRADGRPEPAPT
jgi:hypothetical protein